MLEDGWGFHGGEFGVLALGEQSVQRTSLERREHLQSTATRQAIR
jgi:hypothetical protein